MTVFTDTDFRGESRLFAANIDQAQLERTFSERIESVKLACR